MRRLSFETVGSITAIVVGVAALFVAWDEARSVRRQQAASVLPIVKMETPFMNGDDERSFRIEVRNVGVGPAFFDRADILWDGELVTVAEELKFNAQEAAGEAGFWTSELDGYVLGGGESMLLYEVTWEPGAKGAEQRAYEVAALIRRSVQVEACYCSVYDDCWRTELNRQGRPEPADRCRPRE